MKPIFNECLREYCSRDYYPWHMPGHKRQTGLFTGIGELEEQESAGTLKEGLRNINFGVGLDITEVPGLDNLLAPEGIIAESMAQLPEVYGSRKSYYLVNGSTSGILTAVSAVCNPGDTIIMSRNCHKAVYHIVALLDLKPVYIYPSMIQPYGICGSITPDQVKTALNENPEAKAVIFPSPTYEGILSDVREISKIVHQAGRRLIVDEAHGAHLEFSGEFPESAVRCGADLVIESLHKTLPCYTQCAILHVGNTEIEIMETQDQNVRIPEAESGNIKCKEEKPAGYEELIERVERYLGVYQTSSPSYLFVAAMEDCIATMEEWRQTRMVKYVSTLKHYRKQWQGLKWIHLLSREEVRRGGNFAYDESKLVFCMPEYTWTGEEFLKEIEEEYGMVLEMASLNYVLAMTSVADTEDGFERLHSALLKMDHRASEYRLLKKVRTGCSSSFMGNAGIKTGRVLCNSSEKAELLPGRAIREKMTKMVLSEAAGRIAGEYVTVYPPGIPVFVPGERISELQQEYVMSCIRSGLTVHGVWQETSEQGDDDIYIKVIM